MQDCKEGLLNWNALSNAVNAAYTGCALVTLANAAENTSS